MIGTFNVVCAYLKMLGKKNSTFASIPRERLDVLEKFVLSPTLENLNLIQMDNGL